MFLNIINWIANFFQNIFLNIKKNKVIFLFIFFLLFVFFVFLLDTNVLLATSIVITAYVFTIKPEIGLYFLSIFIPLKALIRNADILPSIFLTLIIPIVLLSTYLGYRTKYEEKELTITKTDIYLIIIFLASIFSSVGFAIIYGFRGHQLLDFFVWLQLIGFYLMGKIIFTKISFEKFLLFNLIIANVVSLYSVFQYFSITTNNWIESYELINVRVYGTLGNPNALAGYLIMILFTNFLFFFKKSNIKKLLLFFPLPVLVIILTFSRSVWIVGIFGFIIFLLFIRNYKAIFVFFVGIILLYLLSPVVIKARIQNILNPQHLSYSSDSGRLWAFRNVMYINKDKAFFGNGWGSYGGEFAYSNASPIYLEGIQGGTIGVANTDNQWLQVYAQQGAVGILLYLLLYKDVLYRNKNLLVIPLLMFVSLGLFIDVFQFYQIAFWGWLILGVLSVDKLREEKEYKYE